MPLPTMYMTDWSTYRVNKLTSISIYTPCIVHTHFQYDLYFHICFSSWITKMCQHPFSMWPIFLFLVSILNNKRFLMVPIPYYYFMHPVISGHLFSCSMWEPPWWASKKMHIRISKLFKNFFPLCTNFFFLFTLSFIASLTNISTSLPIIG